MKSFSEIYLSSDLKGRGLLFVAIGKGVSFFRNAFFGLLHRFFCYRFLCYRFLCYRFRAVTFLNRFFDRRFLDRLLFLWFFDSFSCWFFDWLGFWGRSFDFGSLFWSGEKRLEPREKSARFLLFKLLSKRSYDNKAFLISQIATQVHILVSRDF